MRDVLIYAVWSEGKYTLHQTGQLFGVGYTSVVNAGGRADKQLARGRRLRATLALGVGPAANDK